MADVLLTVGNSMMGDDGAGPLLADMLNANPVEGWLVIDGGSMPENHTHRVLAEKPGRVVVVDATDMGLKPGEIRVVDERCMAEIPFMTTHNMPVSYLIERLREQVEEVVFVGIQPAVVAFSFPMMDEVRQAVEALYERLRTGQNLDGLECLIPA